MRFQIVGGTLLGPGVGGQLLRGCVQKLIQRGDRKHPRTVDFDGSDVAIPNQFLDCGFTNAQVVRSSRKPVCCLGDLVFVGVVHLYLRSLYLI